MARMRSLTELYIVSRATDRIPADVMSTTGATIAWTAVTAIGFTSPADQPGDGWGEAGPATLERVLFHLVQGYARHVGHLDIVSELTGGQIGE
jgi:hypothetical protein